MPTLRLFAQIREKVSQREVQIEGEHSILETLQILARRFPQIKEDLFAPNGELRRIYHILVNQESQEDLSTVVKKGDIIAIIPPVGGGGIPTFLWFGFSKRFNKNPEMKSYA